MYKCISECDGVPRRRLLGLHIALATRTEEASPRCHASVRCGRLPLRREEIRHAVLRAGDGVALDVVDGKILLTTHSRITAIMTFKATDLGFDQQPTAWKLP